jgi:hypothetical protein
MVLKVFQLGSVRPNAYRREQPVANANIGSASVYHGLIMLLQSLRELYL